MTLVPTVAPTVVVAIMSLVSSVGWLVVVVARSRARDLVGPRDVLGLGAYGIGRSVGRVYPLRSCADEYLSAGVACGGCDEWHTYKGDDAERYESNHGSRCAPNTGHASMPEGDEGGDGLHKIGRLRIYFHYRQRYSKSIDEMSNTLENILTIYNISYVKYKKYCITQ